MARVLERRYTRQNSEELLCYVESRYVLAIGLFPQPYRLLAKLILSFKTWSNFDCSILLCLKLIWLPAYYFYISPSSLANSPLWATAFLTRFFHIASGFHLFWFRNRFRFQSKVICLAPQAWKTRSLHLCPPAIRWPSYTAKARGFFFAPYNSQGYCGAVLACRHAGTTFY